MTNDTDRPSEWLRAKPHPSLDAAPPTDWATRAMTVDWAARHNRAVEAFLAERAGARGGHSLTRHERAILSLADGIDQYVSSAPDHADPLSGESLFSLVTGFRGLLNYDLGRLDGGTLDGWACRICERWGIDPDTGEWVGGA